MGCSLQAGDKQSAASLTCMQSDISKYEESM